MKPPRKAQTLGEIPGAYYLLNQRLAAARPQKARNVARNTVTVILLAAIAALLVFMVYLLKQ